MSDIANGLNGTLTRVGRASGFKLVAIAFLTMVMSVPLLMILSIANDREEYARAARQSISQGWGGEQRVIGPFLVVPYKVPEEVDGSGRVVSAATSGEFVVAPQNLSILAEPKTETRSRGIFDVTVYTGTVEMTGAFPNLQSLREIVPSAVLDWTQARVGVGISDVRGISGDVLLNWAGKDVNAFEPGSSIGGIMTGVRTKLPTVDPAADAAFKLTIPLRGLGRFSFVPVGKAFTAQVRSAWPHPSFDGAFLPETRTITADGFDATWKVSYLAQQTPQTWINKETSYPASYEDLGVSFYQPVDFYQLVARSIKYAVLFVGLAFLTFFLIETVAGARLHIVQYLLAGSAQVVFYLLLLALAEQLGFAAAYFIAAVACIALTSLYVWSIMRSLARGGIVAFALSVLYALLYVLLNEEDYALLTGAVAIFLALALTMFLTRRIDWYGTPAETAAVANAR